MSGRSERLSLSMLRNRFHEIHSTFINRHWYQYITDIPFSLSNSKSRLTLSHSFWSRNQSGSQQPEIFTWSVTSRRLIESLTAVYQQTHWMLLIQSCNSGALYQLLILMCQMDRGVISFTWIAFTWTFQTNYLFTKVIKTCF